MTAPCRSAVYRILGWCPLTAPQLAYLLRGRWAGRTVQAAVERWRIAGRVAWTGRRVHGARQWRRKDQLNPTT